MRWKGGTIIAAAPTHPALPTDRGYAVVAMAGCGIWIVSAIVSWLVPRRGSAVDVDEALADESVADAVPVDEAPPARERRRG